jgi:glutathione S-transferase
MRAQRKTGGHPAAAIGEEPGMLTLYHYPSSPCAAKVRAVLSEKRLDWDGIVVDIIEKENLTPDYLKLNPKGVVPVLVDDGDAIAESSIIMEYLDTAYDTDSLKPESALGRARMRKWLKWVDGTQHPNWPGLAWIIIIRPIWLAKSKAETDALLDPARRERQVRLLKHGFDAPDFEAAMRVLDRTLGDMEAALANRDWLVDDKPTLADLAVLPYVIGAEKFGLDIMLAGRPRVAAWLDRWRATPTWQATAPWDLDEATRTEVRERAAAPWQRIVEADAA